MIPQNQRAVLQLTPEEIRIVERLREYRTDRAKHAAQCLRIVNKEARLVPLTYNKPQLILDAKAQAQKEQIGMVRALVLKGRKQGASTYIASRLYARTRLWKHQHAKVMAHNQDSSDTLFGMVKTYHDNDPLALTADNSSAKLLRFSNDSSYSVSTAGGSGESGRGGSPSLVHMSEVAFYKDAQKNFASMAGSVSTAAGTEIWAESTANGVGNPFHVRWSLAEAGLNEATESFGYIPIFIPWFISDEYALPVPSHFELKSEAEGEGLPSERDLAEMFDLTLEQMAWRRFQIEGQFGGSVELFMQEYPCTPVEAFQTPGLDLFIKPAYVLRARRRQGIQAFGPRILGVDPAGMGGDKFSMTLRQGSVVHWHKGRAAVEPGEEQVEWVYDTMIENGVDRCNIDYSGGYGSALLAGLRERHPDVAGKCFPVNFGEKSQFKMVNPDRPGPRNRRAEMYERAREWFQNPEGVSIPDEDELQSDLGAISVKIGGQSTDLLLESKPDIKRRLQRSPDVADSFVLTFAVPDRAISATLTHGPIPANAGQSDVKRGESVADMLKPMHNDPYSQAARYGSGDGGGSWMI